MARKNMTSQLVDIWRDFDAPMSIPQTCRALKVTTRRILWARALMRASTPRSSVARGFRELFMGGFMGRS